MDRDIVKEFSDAFQWVKTAVAERVAPRVGEIACPECGETTPVDVPVCMWCDANLEVPCGC